MPKNKRCGGGMCLMVPKDKKLGNKGPYWCLKCGRKSPGFMGIKSSDKSKTV